MELKYEFEDREELHKALENLHLYHDCDLCHGKMVMISRDNLGNTTCGYCGEIVRYPRMSREAFERELKKEGFA